MGERSQAAIKVQRHVQMASVDCLGHFLPEGTDVIAAAGTAQLVDRGTADIAVVGAEAAAVGMAEVGVEAVAVGTDHDDPAEWRTPDHTVGGSPEGDRSMVVDKTDAACC